MTLSAVLRPLLGLLLAIASPVLLAQSFSGTNVGAIPDGGFTGTNGPDAYAGTRDVRFDVSGLEGTVETVSVEFSADHTFVGDLRVTLISPIGVPHLIFSRTGATAATSFGNSGDLVATNTYRFSDSASVNWWAHTASATPIPGVTARTTSEGGAGSPDPAPATSLDAAFASTPPNGTWILRFEDGAAADTGEVVSATLELTVRGVTRVVTNNNGNLAGSLEQVLPLAQPGDLITFGEFFDTPVLYQLDNALPVIDHALAIQGPGAELLTIRRRDTSPDFRIFNVNAGVETVSLSGMSISNGSIEGFGAGVRASSPIVLSGLHVFGNLADNAGGAYFRDSNATVVDSTFSGNRTRFQSAGIGFFNSGPIVRLLGVTISDNRADSFPGAMNFQNFSGSKTLEIVNSTITNNFAASPAGGIGIFGFSGAVDTRIKIRNSIVSDNGPSNFAVSGDGTLAIESTGFNLSDDYNGLVSTLPSDLTGDARLGPLGLHGGNVPTRIPLDGSPALDNGKAFTGGPRGGARGEARLFDSPDLSNPDNSNGADIGAVEVQTIFVTSADDSGAGSLRQAIADANANGPGLDDLVFGGQAFLSGQPQAIDLVTALPEINSALTLNGPSARLLTVQRSAPEDFRIFRINGGLDHVAMSGLTVRNGRGEAGGAISTSSPFSLTESVLADNESTARSGGAIEFVGVNGWIERSAVIDNVSAEDGGGIVSFGSNGSEVKIIQSTVSGNQAALRGGGVANLVFDGSGELSIIQSTIANNEAAIEFDAVASLLIDANFAFVFLDGSILSGRPDTPVVGSVVFGSGVSASVSSLGFNLFTDDFSTGFPQSTDILNADPALTPLRTFGGPTPVHGFLPGSDAIDGATRQGSRIAGDQRGSRFPRLVDLDAVNPDFGDGTDVGAFEAQNEPQGDAVFADRFEID